MNKLLAFFCFSALLIAQPPARPAVTSPEVHSDGRVTFRLFEPNAAVVTVSVEGLKDPLPMTKDQQSVWSATSDSLAPDLYGYSFTVDGTHVVDPSNTEVKPNLMNLSNVVHVPGATPLPWE